MWSDYDMMSLRCTGCANDPCNKETCLCRCHKSEWVSTKAMDNLREYVDFMVNIDDEKEVTN